MFFVCIAMHVVCIARIVEGDGPNFRVLAPEFICHNDDDSFIKPPDNTVVTIKTDASELVFSWTVRWTPLHRPSQRQTLLLWKTVRGLEVKLNREQPEPFVYVIDNDELLEGIEFVFNVTASEPGSDNSTSKTFHIDNVKGDQKLTIEGRVDKFSVLLIGAEELYTNMKYVMEAEITTCTPTQDYYFVWRVESASLSFNAPNMSGARLELPPYTLQAGASYEIICSVYRNNHEFITQTSLPLQVLYRGLEVSLNLDVLIVSLYSRFTIEAIVVNHDYHDEVPQFEWSCNYESEPCASFSSIDSETLSFPNGLANLGLYEITVTVNVLDQQAVANISVKVVEATLPSIQIKPLPRMNNEQSIIRLVANASDVTPSCSLTWYFASMEYLANVNTWDDSQHGEALSESITILSLEENFLNELTDFTNETEWRQVTVQLPAAAGRARFVAQCGCSLTFNCETEGVAYGDIFFELNKPPEVGEVKISPESGVAMETVFRVSTPVASDDDRPLWYSFYCKLGINDTLLLGSNLDYSLVDTFLPYVVATGTELWVEVCNSLGACSTSEVMRVDLEPGEGRTLDALVATIEGLVARCEVLMLERLVKSAVITYVNASQKDVLSKLLNKLETIQTEGTHCHDDYQNLLEYSLMKFTIM